MAEPNRCPYCQIGIPMWIWDEANNIYTLLCSHCDAKGEYKKAHQEGVTP